MKTQDQYEDAVRALASLWRAYASERIEMGWAPDFAFADAADLAARVGRTDEATIQMMTQAAAWLLYPPSRTLGWTHAEAFGAWWNARFPDAPRLYDSGFAAPCLVDLGAGQQAAFIATWSMFCASVQPERADA